MKGIPYKRLASYLRYFISPWEPKSSGLKELMEVLQKHGVSELDGRELQCLGAAILQMAFDKMAGCRYESTYIRELPAGCPGKDHEYRMNEATVLEPYSLSEDEVRNLLVYCGQHNLKFHIDGFSRHFPGRTLRIVLRS